MSEANRFFDGLGRKYSKDLHTSFLGEVTRYDATKMQADVQPLASQNELAYPTIVNLPVAHTGNGTFVIHVPLEKGDIVAVMTAEHDIDNILLGNSNTNVQTERSHELDDSIVVGKITPFTDVQTLNDTDLHIGTRDGATSITMTPAGSIIIEAGTIELGAGATEGVALGTSLESYLNSHSHSAGGSGPPTSPSPSPSTKVKVL